jgi:DNA-directed RNA polymerase specialized sigma24 family protein
VTALSDDALRQLIRSDPDAGWRAFIDHYTPLLVGLLRKAGLSDRDEVMDVYVLICEQLSANGCERLKSHDTSRGRTGAWLGAVTRNAVIDWIRSKKGRRRLFQSVKDLPRFDQRVFELYYWDERTLAEMAEILAQETGAAPDIAAVAEAMERVQQVLTERHRADLLALAVRSKAAVAIDDTDEADRVADPQADPETSARAAQLNAGLETALSKLPAEDAAIVRLKFVEGLGRTDIERAIGVALTPKRLQEVLDRLRAILAGHGVDRADVGLSPFVSLDRTAQ